MYGPVNTNNVFRGFGGTCEARNNGDAVVRYDQLARRWLIVMPIFCRAAERSDQPPVWSRGDAAYESPAGRRQISLGRLRHSFSRRIQFRGASECTKCSERVHKRCTSKKKVRIRCVTR